MEDSTAEPATQDAPVVNSKSTWFTPKRLLVIFCTMNLLNYLDRGTISSNGVNGKPRLCNGDGICDSGSGIQGDFKLNNFQDGVLSSAFMVGLLVASPIFASLAKSHNPFRLIGVGMLVWTLATAGCGFSFEFWTLTVCRMFVGVGEASFISLAAPFIDDSAPPAQRASWLAIFYMCIPSGVALGYVYGGLVGKHLSWRYAFWGESIFMLPFVILGFIVKPLQLKGFHVSEEVELPVNRSIPVNQDVPGEMTVQNPEAERTTNFQSTASMKPSWSKMAKNILFNIKSFWKDLMYLLVDKIYVINVLGFIAYNFVIGAYSYWGPKAGYAIYHLENTDFIFGGITLICGIFGTLAGGLVLDFIRSTIPNAFKVLFGATFLGAILCFGAFCTKQFPGFVALFSVGELLLFAIQGPVHYVFLHCVKPSMRPLSMALGVVSIHIFGDVPSSPLVGVLQDHLQNWRETTLILSSVLFLASGIWFVGIFLHPVDRYDEDSEQDSS